MWQQANLADIYSSLSFPEHSRWLKSGDYKFIGRKDIVEEKHTSLAALSRLQSITYYLPPF